jgi:hypothetical protein
MLYYMTTAEHLATATEVNKDSSNAQSKVTGHTQSLTFADAVRQTLIPPPPGHTAAVTRGCNTLWQIIIDKAPESNGSSLMGLTEKEAVNKANLALASMDDRTMPSGANFVGAMKLCNGVNGSNRFDMIKAYRRHILSHNLIH